MDALAALSLSLSQSRSSAEETQLGGEWWRTKRGGQRRREEAGNGAAAETKAKGMSKYFRAYDISHHICRGSPPL